MEATTVSSPPTIRPAVEADVPEVRACVLEAYTIYLDRLDRPPAPMHDDYEARVREGYVFVASDGPVFGVVVLIPRPDHLFLENMAVRLAHQGQGTGTRLLGFAESRARALGLPEVRLYTNARMTENLRFYRARGYREIGRRVENGYDRVFLSKRLGPVRDGEEFK
jgi:GNAT superfamily N-acetyltransferase